MNASIFVMLSGAVLLLSIALCFIATGWNSSLEEALEQAALVAEKNGSDFIATEIRKIKNGGRA